MGFDPLISADPTVVGLPPDMPEEGAGRDTKAASISVANII
jgi:hypothetical protein